VFAPEGFISLDEIDEILGELAWEWHIAAPHPDIAKPTEVFEEAELFGEVDLTKGRPRAYKEWLFQCFLNRHERELYACSPTGQPLKLSTNIVARVKIYDGPFDDTEKGWKGIISHVNDSFSCISSIGYTVSLDQARKWKSSDTFEKMKKTLNMIDALPVCWKTPKGQDLLDWLKICGVDKTDGTDNTDMSAKAISERVLAAKRDCPTLTRSEVKEQVAPTVSIGRFRLGWSMAAQKEPSISKPGRKS
jgi:hypothetical protein